MPSGAREISTTTNTMEPEVTKFDYAVANHLRNNLPIKEAMFGGITRVNYFIGDKAVDLLMESKWAKADSDDVKFKTRKDAAMFLNELLMKRFYHRSKKIVKQDGTKKKFKLDMHDVQVFVDAKQPYVWIYEPTSLKAWLYCIGVIVLVIAICIFPLWPPFLRSGVYYLCIAGLVFLSSILGLALLRHVVFFILWTITFGKVHLWILPNLTEDVGFFESFWPLYTLGQCETSGGADSPTNGGEADVSLSSTGGGGSGLSDAAHSHQD